jgi:heme/copper-type cytochrome/quinol oxidase subunit 3
MQKLKTYGSLVLALMSVFTLGAYTEATLRGTKEILAHQWMLTSFFGLMFLVYFLEEYRKE